MNSIFREIASYSGHMSSSIRMAQGDMHCLLCLSLTGYEINKNTYNKNPICISPPPISGLSPFRVLSYVFKGKNLRQIFFSFTNFIFFLLICEREQLRFWLEPQNIYCSSMGYCKDVFTTIENILCNIVLCEIFSGNWLYL